MRKSLINSFKGLTQLTLLQKRNTRLYFQISKFCSSNTQDASDKNKQNSEQPNVNAQSQQKAQEAPTEQQVNEMIDKWVKDNKVCLFMKGTPQMPMCGYSNFVVQVLKFYKIKDYQSVDILKNESVRKQIKVYSNWPTFPQLFVEGKLIGGSDIVSEMHKDGSLKTLFQKTGLIQDE